MLELIQKIKTYTEAGIILEHMELFDELKDRHLSLVGDFEKTLLEMIKVSKGEA